MARDWVKSFESWGQGPSDTEEDERRRTEREIDDALRANQPLQNKRISVYAKGSYRRGTNVRRGSDIDIAAELLGSAATGESFITDKAFRAKDLTDDELGLHDVDLGYSVSDLKDAVHTALRNAFGNAAVTRRNKCIQVRERATTLPADVVPCRTYRRYDNRDTHHNGILIRPDRGDRIINWPRQDDDNGTLKNNRTRRRFKRAVRGIKSLENEMVKNGAIEPVASFMMECAVYNVPDSEFDNETNYVNCLHAIRVMAEVADDPGTYKEWEEVNGLKYLFRPSQSWSIDDMARLVKGSVDYLGIGK